jgi:hypothetical protein
VGGEGARSEAVSYVSLLVTLKGWIMGMGWTAGGGQRETAHLDGRTLRVDALCIEKRG